MALPLPRPLRHRLEAGLARLLIPDDAGLDAFTSPAGAASLVDAGSVSWKVFKNPLSVFIGGVTAVILELAEPRVRSGVWLHGSFRTQPLARLRRTGYAAMVTVYGTRAAATSMIAEVRRKHAQVRGVTPAGEPYAADDAVLLDWVHATACFGFLNAYHAYVQPLSGSLHDRFYAEAQTAAALYGATSAPGSRAQLDALFVHMQGRLERSDIVLEFLDIVRCMPALPRGAGPLQRLLVDAAVQLVPMSLRERLGLQTRPGFDPWRRRMVCALGAAADRVVLSTHPAVLACRRLGLADDWLLDDRLFDDTGGLHSPP